MDRAFRILFFIASTAVIALFAAIFTWPRVSQLRKPLEEYRLLSSQKFEQIVQISKMLSLADFLLPADYPHCQTRALIARSNVGPVYGDSKQPFQFYVPFSLNSQRVECQSPGFGKAVVIESVQSPIRKILLDSGPQVTVIRQPQMPILLEFHSGKVSGSSEQLNFTLRIGTSELSLRSSGPVAFIVQALEGGGLYSLYLLKGSSLDVTAKQVFNPTASGSVIVFRSHPYGNIKVDGVTTEGIQSQIRLLPSGAHVEESTTGIEGR